MGGGPGGPERSEKPTGSGVSRRRFLAGSLLAIGGSSALANGATVARFSDSLDSNGNEVRIDGDPTLTYIINDQTENNKPQYEITYQVEWVADFDYIDISMDIETNGEDDSPGQDSENWYGLTDQSGTVSSQGQYGGHGGDTFEFIFRVYDSNGNQVIEKIDTDEPDGDGQSEGNFGNANSPAIDSFTVYDNWNSGNGYDVEYFVSDTSDFDGFVQVRFKAQNWNAPKATATEQGDNLANDTVSHNVNGGDDGDRTWNITVEVVNDEDGNEIVADSATVNDDNPGDGNNSHWP